MNVTSVGTVFWMEDTGTVGAEQEGPRMWVVLSVATAKSGVVVACPITTKPTQAANANTKPWCVPYSADDITTLSPVKDGWVLVHQVRSISTERRMDQLSGKLSLPILTEVRRRLASLLRVALDDE